MIIVKLQGGLGNQMFQYALGRVISLKYKSVLKLDLGHYVSRRASVPRVYSLDVFNIKAETFRESWQGFLFKLINYKKEKKFSFDQSILSFGSRAYLDGYWQSPKYFQGYEDVIRSDFTLKNPPSGNIQNLQAEISSANSLGVHVRRGDYVGNKSHEVITKDYYKEGIAKILNLTSIEKIYIFSDDIGWCRENMKFDVPTVFVGDEFSGEKGEGHMYLMSSCKNFIIANSSFSWWAAWLSRYEKKIVVCPKQWFPDASIDTSDLIPKEWIRI